MLSLHVVTPHQGQHYYRQENYYSQGTAVENSQWFGHGAAELGLSGTVETKSFERLLVGSHPTNNQSLTGRGERQSGKQRAGIDLTFSAPKSVSLAALVAGDSRLEEAHRLAVQKALEVAEQRYAVARSGSRNDRQTEVTGNLVVAEFHHDTSRAKDPQLHTHCVLINAVKRTDGQWRSLCTEEYFRNSKLLGLVYQNELAQRVQALGYGIRSKVNGTFEISGYSEEQLKAFSKRRQQLDSLGATSQREARTLVMVNRPVKGPELPRKELLERWNAEAQGYGVEHPRTLAGRLSQGALDMREVVAAAARHASERDVEFRREDMERFALQQHLGRLDWQSFQDKVQDAEVSHSLIPTRPGRYITRDALLIEQRIIERLEAGAGRYEPLVREIPERIADNTIGLTAGQKGALEMTLSTHDQVVGWQGVAGAGKTFALKELRSIAQAQGVIVRGFAPSAEAAKVLELESGIQSDTVAGLLVSPTRRAPGTELWIVDEAGLLSARDAERLLHRAQDAQARVVLVGDTRQLSSVEAGSPFKLLQESGMTTAHLTESRRQKVQALKEAASAMARGEMTEGLRHLASGIIEYRREATRIAHVAAEYLALSKEDRSQTLILAGTNRERDLLTEAIRQGLRDEGRLGDQMVVKTLRAKDLSREEIQGVFGIATGDVLVFHKNYAHLGISKNMQLAVTGADPSDRSLKARLPDGKEVSFVPSKTPGFQVYEVRERELAAGDLVRWTRNDRARNLRNGQDLKVEGVGDEIVLSTNSGKRIRLAKDGRHYLDHSYVSTVYASQGKTSERVIISTDQTFGKEAMYVAVTRARREVTIYTENRERMIAIAEVSRAKLSAKDLVASKKNAPERINLRELGRRRF